jgi:hypothetical protein
MILAQRSAYTRPNNKPVGKITGCCRHITTLAYTHSQVTNTCTHTHIHPCTKLLYDDAFHHTSDKDHYTARTHTHTHIRACLVSASQPSHHRCMRTELAFDRGPWPLLYARYACVCMQQETSLYNVAGKVCTQVRHRKKRTSHTQTQQHAIKRTHTSQHSTTLIARNCNHTRICAHTHTQTHKPTPTPRNLHPNPDPHPHPLPCYVMGHLSFELLGTCQSSRCQPWEQQAWQNRA